MPENLYICEVFQLNRLMRSRQKTTWLFSALVIVSLASFIYVNVHAFVGSRSSDNQAAMSLQRDAATEEQQEQEGGGRFVLPDTEVVRRLMHAVSSLMPRR